MEVIAMKILNAIVVGALTFIGAGISQLAIANTSASAASRLGSSNLSDAHTATSGQAVNASSSQAGGYSGTAIGQSSGTSNAAEGSLRAYASANGSTVAPSPSGSINVAGYARASWNDYLTIGAGNLFGQQGYITAELNLSGAFSGSLLGAPQAYSGELTRYASLQILGTGMSGNCGGWNYCEVKEANGTLGVANYSPSLSVINVSIPLTFGFQAGLSYTMDVIASAFVLTRGSLGSSADSAIDYTLSWGAITGVFEKNGNAVSNFTATSTSGFDYLRQVAAPIPEPETYAMMLAGLGLIGVMTRRRRQKLNA
jgi:hypothetical protein